MLKRKVDLFLKNWKENINKKPLIISGARQIGKTTSIRELGKTYESFIEIDFVKMSQSLNYLLISVSFRNWEFLI